MKDDLKCALELGLQMLDSTWANMDQYPMERMKYLLNFHLKKAKWKETYEFREVARSRSGAKYTNSRRTTVDAWHSGVLISRTCCSCDL